MYYSLCNVNNDGPVCDSAMDWVDKISEQRILEAEKAGVLDNLPGAGQPLPPDPFARLPEEVRLAARVLYKCGCAPQEVIVLKEFHEAQKRLHEPGTTKEKAQRLKEFCDAELKYNIAMDRHRQMSKGRIFSR